MHSIKSDDSHYILFRGDHGLPMGMLPVSPYTRRLLWQGHSLQEALDICTAAVDSLYSEGIDDRRIIMAELMWYTEINHFQNPFTSTTDDLGRAILYATRQQTSDRGYISVLKIKRERCTSFREFVDNPTTRSENEYGVDGLILPEEILLQIPIKAIDVQFYLSGPLTKADSISHFLSAYAQEKYVFDPSDKQTLSCPGCHGALSDYLCEVLGFESGALRLFALPEMAETEGIYGERLLSREAMYLERMTMHGMVVRCPQCKQYICLPERLSSLPLEMIKQTYRKEAVRLELRNTSDEAIWYVVLKASYKAGSERTVEYYYNNLKLGSEDLLLTGIVGPPSIKTALYREYRKLYDQANKRMGGGIIQPGAELRYTLFLGYDPTDKVNFQLIVYRLHFTSGKTWLSPLF